MWDFLYEEFRVLICVFNVFIKTGNLVDVMTDSTLFSVINNDYNDCLCC